MNQEYKEPKDVRVNAQITFSQKRPFVLIAGPCQIESEQHSFDMAGALQDITRRLEIPLVYKSSFDKANRTSIAGKRGIGLEAGLEILGKLKKELSLTVLTDVHEASQCDTVAATVDILQIPAFLCRQTDLLLAAARTGRTVNVKKGQFLAPWDIASIAKKLESAGNTQLLFTERGSSFGYNNLVVDMRSLPIMAHVSGYPVIFDATHSTQKPGGLGSASGGQREFAPILARAAVAVGVAGVFMEVHQDPDSAPSDGPSMVKLSELERILEPLKRIHQLMLAQTFS